MNTKVFKTEPAVFAVGNTYQIMVPVKTEVLMWVKVGDKCFYDHANGTMRSMTDIHRMTVPMELLDKAKEYTICYRIMIERKRYFTETEEICEEKFSFTPVKGIRGKAYLIADAHSIVEPAVEAAKKFEEKHGEMDFLIMAGDVPNDSAKTEYFDVIYEIAGQITHGTKPIVYAKGNHDLRGICADKMDDYSPISNGNSYFSFRIGDIWGLSLDCGEDKPDDHEEYGHTVCCHQFRLEETEYIKDIIKNADKEYEAEGVRRKIIISHNPFSELLQPPFDIEKEIYGEWCRLLRENVKPEIMISGHFHRLAVNEMGGEKDHLGQPCRVVIGTKPFSDEENNRHYIGTGFFFNENDITFEFNDDMGNIYEI